MSEATYNAALRFVGSGHVQSPPLAAWAACREARCAYVQLSAAQRKALSKFYTEAVDTRPAATLVVNTDNTDNGGEYQFKEHAKMRIV